MITRESKKRRLDLKWVAAAVLALVFVTSAFAQEELLPDEELQMVPEEAQMPGTIEGTGTYFEVTDSEYLNIALQSSEPVHLTLESVPQMVVMHIEAAEGASSTWISLTGFAPSTTYYKYEDDYHNEVAFTTDGSGSYTFAQDLVIPHLVFIQPQAGTYFLAPGQGKIPPIGEWVEATRTFTLTTDVSETIQIDEDNLTLDGAGHTVSGSGTGYGVYLPWRTGVTIQNLTVQGFTRGIYLRYSSNNNTLTANTTSNNYHGIYLHYSSYNTLTGNTANSNNHDGILLTRSSGNTLTGNTFNSNNERGIFLGNSSNNTTLTDNTLSNNDYGIYHTVSSGSTLTGNSMSGNRYNFRVSGELYSHYDHNIDTSNTVDGKPVYYLNGITGGVYDSSTNAGVFYAINCNGITIKDVSLTNNRVGVFLWNTHNSTIENVLASNSWTGIYLTSSSGNTLTANTANSNDYYGIYLSSSSGNTLTGNTANSNDSYGIYLDSSSGNTLTGNTISNNGDGIYIRDSSDNTLTGNSMSGNGYNFHVLGDYQNNVDTSNTVEGKPVYYVVNDVDGIYDSSTNAGVFYAINCDNITIKDLTLSNNKYGVFLWNTNNSTIENVVASNNTTGIRLQYSNNNTLTGNTTTNNAYGISLYYYCSDNTLIGNTATWNYERGIWSYLSSNNTLTGNTVSNNRYGIYLQSSGENGNNILTGNTANSNSDYGIYLRYSSNNTLTGNTASNNTVGIFLESSSNYNDLIGNTVSYNGYGIYFFYWGWGTGYCKYNETYNNNFIDNSLAQASVGGTGGNIFNLPVPVGGNYWSDHTTPDNNGDGFVDSAYVFTGGRDNLPWASPFNQPPVARDDIATTDEDTAVTIDVLANDSDADVGDTLTVSSVTQGANGSVVNNGNGTVTYTPNADLYGTDTFTYTVSDGRGGTDTATVTITVNPVNDPPVASDDSATTDEDTAVTVDVLANDSDIDSVSLTAVWLSGPSHGSLTPNADGSFTYSPDTNYNGTDNFGYKANDGSDNSNEATVTITVNPVNDPPVVGAIIAPLEPVQVDTIVAAGALFSDPDILDTHTAEWDWGDGSTSDGTVDEVAQNVIGSHPYTTAGVYTVTLTVSDGETSDKAVFQYVVVYDPSAGFVTGGGWIYSPAGALLDSDAEGKASFGFVAKYKKGATVPQGNTEFRFQAGDLNFHSSSYDWLVVNQGGTNAQFKGSGTVNGGMAPNGEYYRFMLWAGDDEVDTFRIRIWEEDEDSGDEWVVYDNGFNQEIGGGSIVVHAK